MSWITLSTDADFLAAINSPELTALRGAATAQGQADPLLAIAADVVEDVRYHVATCLRNRIGPAGTIPASLRGAALDIFRFKATLRLPGVKMLQEDARRLAYTNAEARLQRVAECRLAVEQPEDPLEADVGGVSDPQVGDPRTTFERGHTVL